MKTPIERLLETLSHVVLIAGVVFAALEYTNNKERHKFTSSQSFILHNNEERLYDARKIAIADATSQQVSSSFPEQLYRKYYEVRFENNEIDRAEFFIAIISLVQFYDAVSQCYLDPREACNKPILNENFSEIIRQMLEFHGPYINDLRATIPDLGENSCRFLAETLPSRQRPPLCEQLEQQAGSGS